MCHYSDCFEMVVFENVTGLDDTAERHLTSAHGSPSYRTEHRTLYTMQRTKPHAAASSVSQALAQASQPPMASVMQTPASSGH